jgi:hypothetical protein
VQAYDFAGNRTPSSGTVVARLDPANAVQE